MLRHREQIACTAAAGAGQLAVKPRKLRRTVLRAAFSVALLTEVIIEGQRAGKRQKGAAKPLAIGRHGCSPLLGPSNRCELKEEKICKRRVTREREGEREQGG